MKMNWDLSYYFPMQDANFSQEKINRLYSAAKLVLFSINVALVKRESFPDQIEH